MSDGKSSARLTSLDQFRGYSVAGMFVVNFLGGLAITPPILKHNNTHFSLADSIMPSFIFACGFSFRMTFLKRLATQDAPTVRAKFLARSLGLILLSVMLFGFNASFNQWSSASIGTVYAFWAQLLKANLWEVLAIIGATQILLLPVVARSFSVRLIALLALAVAHTFLSWWFNYEFVYGRPNWLDTLVGTTGKRAWDGGLFGLLAWSEIMLVGTLAFDTMQAKSLASASKKLLAGGLAMMFIGYGLSCLTTLYDVIPSGAEISSTDPATKLSDSQFPQPPFSQSPLLNSKVQKRIEQLSASPVWPPLNLLANREARLSFATPPWVVPPAPEQRVPNYWMMDKRVVTQSFTFFAAGFALALYAVFVFVCDIHQRGSDVFRTFGQNPLAAYIIHHMVDKSILGLVPRDSPWFWCLPGLVLSFAITFFFVKFLEKRGLYLRL